MWEVEFLRQSVVAEGVLLTPCVQETTLVARCELHSVAEVKGSEVLLTINALNEFDSRITGVDWRQKIENQRGAVSYRIFWAYYLVIMNDFCVLVSINLME